MVALYLVSALKYPNKSPKIHPPRRKENQKQANGKINYFKKIQHPHSNYRLPGAPPLRPGKSLPTTRINN